MVTREEVFERVCREIRDLFELEDKEITPSTKLIEDLGLDSIDAIDLAARLEELTKKRLAEDNLRSLRTVEDVVNLIVTTLASTEESGAAETGPISLRENVEGS